MNKRLRRMATVLMASIVVVGILGASQAVSARDLLGKDLPGDVSAQQPGELFESDNADQNIELVGHLGGMAQAIEVRGQYAYVGFGLELAILDVSDPAHIQRVGWLVAEGEVMDIAIQGDYAYLTYSDCPAGLQVIDISNPSFPVFIGNIELGTCGYSANLIVSGLSAYITSTEWDFWGGWTGVFLYRMDISNPYHPLIVDTYTLPYGTEQFTGTAAQDGYLYAVWTDYINSYLEVFDISNSFSLVKIASMSIGQKQGNDIALSGDYAYIPVLADGLLVVDISDPAHPQVVINHPIPGSPFGIYIDGTTAYISTDEPAILILDVADPFSPVERETYQTTGPVGDIFVSGSTAYTGNGQGGVEIFDVESLSQSGIYPYTSPRGTYDLIYQNPYAYTASEDGFWILDFSDPTMPIAVTHEDAPMKAVSLAQKNDYIYVAYPGYGLRIVDVSDPPAWKIAGQYILGEDIRQIVLEGNTIYVAAGAAGLYILDISNPVAPVELSSFSRDYSVNAVAVSGGYAYLATSDVNFVILDVSSPDDPEKVGTYSPPSGYCLHDTTAIAVQDDIALLGTVCYGGPGGPPGLEWGSIWIVDVSDPEEPWQVSRLDTGVVRQIAMQSDRAYIVVDKVGLNIYDISNPSTWNLIGSFDPSDTAFGVSPTNEFIYLYGQSIYILRYLDPALPSIAGRVTQANHIPYQGVKVSAGSQLPDQITDEYGAFAFRGIPEGIYTITPSLLGFVFSPPYKVVSFPPRSLYLNFTILPEPVQVDFTPGISTTLGYTDTQGLPTWLEIPSDASATPLTLQVVPTIAAGTPGYYFTGHSFELNASTGGESPADFVFNAPLTVTIRYSPIDVAVITDEEALALWWWDGAAWKDASLSCSPATEYSRDPVNFTLSLPICQTGYYALVGPTRQIYMPVIVSQAR